MFYARWGLQREAQVTVPPSGFKDAIGSSSWIFIVMAVLVWVLLPFGHPAYVATVVPALLLGAVFAIRLLRRKPIGTTSIAPWAERVVQPEMSWWMRLSLWVLSVIAAFLVPSFPGFDSVGTTFIWALLSARWAAALVTAGVLGVFAWAIHVVVEAGVSALTHRQRPKPTDSKAP